MCCSSHTYCVGTTTHNPATSRLRPLPLCPPEPVPLPRGTSRYMKRDRIANVEQTRMKCRANTETFIKTHMTLCVCTAHHRKHIVEQRENTIIYTCKSEKFTRIYVVATHMYTHIHIYMFMYIYMQASFHSRHLPHPTQRPPSLPLAHPLPP